MTKYSKVRIYSYEKFDKINLLNLINFIPQIIKRSLFRLNYLEKFRMVTTKVKVFFQIIETNFYLECNINSLLLQKEKV